MNRNNANNRNAGHGPVQTSRPAMGRTGNPNSTQNASRGGTASNPPAPSRITYPNPGQAPSPELVQKPYPNTNRLPIRDNPPSPSPNGQSAGRGMEAIARPSPDSGPEPYVLNIAQETLRNRRYRTTLWTGRHLQLTVMSIPPGGEIGLEQHSSFDQFICVEEGRGLVRMGKGRDRLDFEQPVGPNVAVIIPAGTWHNLINTGRGPLKLFSVYAPPAHPRGTVHQTREDAEAEERSY